MIRRLLPNGIRLLCEPRADTRTVAVGLFVDVGSRDEPPAQAGVSHFLEHLVFKGTARRSARELADVIDGVGGEVNAYTTQEYTCFYAHILDEHLPLALEVLADMVAHPGLAREELERERSVVLEELAMIEDAPEDLVQDLLSAALFPGHPLGRTVGGSVASVQALTAESVADFHRRYYTGANLVVAVSGLCDPVRVEAQIAERLGDLPSTPARENRLAPAYAAARLRRTKTTEQVHVCLATAAPGLKDEELWSAALLADVFGGGPSSRLFQSLRETRGLCYDVEAFHQPYTDAGAFGIALAAGSATAAQAIAAASDEWDRLRREPVPEIELDRQKQRFRAGFWLGLEGVQARMNRLGRSELLTGQLLSPEEAIACVDRVTAEDILALAERLGRLEDWAAAAVGPRQALGRASCPGELLGPAGGKGRRWAEAAGFRTSKR